MNIASSLAVALVAALHASFLVLEMFLWRTPVGRRIFKTTQEFADASATLAANQGLYNGFLSAGLLWPLLTQGTLAGRNTLTFVLLCVVGAGIYGAATSNRRILLVQALPAAVALLLCWLR